MRIDVSGQRFIFPNECACCGSTADAQITVSASKQKGKRVIHTTTNTWNIPYCGNCLHHVNAASKASSVAQALVWVSFIGGVLMCFANLYVGIGFCLIGLIGTFVIHNNLMTQARAICTHECACVQRAMTYLGWHGTLHQFEIIPQRFAKAFMIANQNKLVNLSSDARNLLGSSGSNLGASVSQSPQRYMS